MEKRTSLANTPQRFFLCTVIFTNLLVLSNTLTAINHKIVKALYQKMQSLKKPPDICPLRQPPMKSSKDIYSRTFNPRTINLE